MPMRCPLRRVSLGLLAVAIPAPLFAETMPGPPDWNDKAASVYLAMSSQTAAHDVAQAPAVPTADIATATVLTPATTPHATDSHVVQAVHQPPAALADDEHRVLAPPKSDTLSERSRLDDGKLRSAASRQPISFGVPAGSVYTIVSALAIAIGAFLLFAWMLRRGVQRSSNALPADVVSVLGRVPLAARQCAELLRVGNKLVLVSLTPDGAETLTEVTDPIEVDRLVGLCQQYSPHSTTKAFEQVFRQLSRESTPGGFLGGDAMPEFSAGTTAYRSHRGETRG